MELGLTTTLQSKIKNRSLAPTQKTDPLFIWEANLTKIHNRNALIIVHPLTRYCMVYANLKQSIWKDFAAFVTTAITESFLREGFSEKAAALYFEKAGNITLTKTHGRKYTGGMIRIVNDLWFIWHWLDTENQFQEILTRKMNHSPSHTALQPDIDYVCPEKCFVKVMKELLENDK